MKDVADTLLELKFAEQHVAELKQQLNKIRSKRSILCGSCGHANRICDTVLMRTKYYVPPRGCSEGDYWLEGEWQFSCQGCSKINRCFFDGPLRKEREDLFKSIYKDLFKSSFAIEEDRLNRNLLINKDLNDRMEYFELLEVKPK